jgi:hypothetical protein
MKLSYSPILCYSFDSTKVAKPIRPPILQGSRCNLKQGSWLNGETEAHLLLFPKPQAEFQSQRDYVTDIVSGVCPIQKWWMTSLGDHLLKPGFRISSK